MRIPATNHILRNKNTSNLISDTELGTKFNKAYLRFWRSQARACGGGDGGEGAIPRRHHHRRFVTYPELFVDPD